MSEFLLPGTDAAPIADVSYRNYEGPLHTRALRWWSVALGPLGILLRRPAFWIVAVLAFLPHAWAGVMLYIQSQGWLSRLPFAAEYPAGQKYAASLFGALDGQWLWLLVLALMAGAGSIAADNRTNALLLYLSRPITKGDYLLGKWMAVFLPVFAVAAAPALVLYVYCLLSYLDDGFLRDEPWLILRLLGAAAVPAALHASLLLGFSAWSRTPRVAGAAYAALFFVGNLVTGAVWLIRYGGNLGEGILVRHLSVGGVIRGLAQNVYDLTLLQPAGSRRRGFENLVLAPPELWVMLAIAAVLVVCGVAAARAKVQAVEVIRG